MKEGFTDNSKVFIDAMNEQTVVALTECGFVAVNYAVKLAPSDTGLLKNSITYAISGEPPAIKAYKADEPKEGRKNAGQYDGTAPKEEKGVVAAYIGTNVEYAVYQEMGTGKSVEGGGGRQDPWAYQDDKGRWHRTNGQKPQPFIKPAVADHQKQYIEIIDGKMRGK